MIEAGTFESEAGPLEVEAGLSHIESIPSAMGVSIVSICVTMKVTLQ